MDGRDLAKREGLTFLLITSAQDAWPHVAMLSVGEVYAPDDSSISLALWPGSQTTRNLSTGGRALLMFVWSNATYYVRVSCTRQNDASVRGRPRALFTSQVEEVLEDVVDYAEITGGIDFRLKRPEEVLDAWAESVEVMRSRSPSAPR